MDSGAVGSLALWGAVGAAGVAAGLGGGSLAARGHPAAVKTAEQAATFFSRAALILASAAVGALAWSLLTGNFALAYVADTTTRQGSWPYRLAGLWGGNGGSLLLWGAIILGAGVAATRRRPAARLVAVAAGGAVLLVAAVAADPFQRLAIPAIDGGGLTPILQYPAMLYHPILLYAGHAGLVAPFALAMAGLATGRLDRAGLATGRLDRAWLAVTRRWMLAAWLLLGVGLVAGAHWAYVELGWGGFWGWDPVENSGLLPWLAATAFLHAARRIAKDSNQGGAVPPGLAALAALPFCLSLLGAAISRSGAAQSVHAFAQATAVGRGLTAVLVAAVAALMALVVRAQRRLTADPTADRPIPSGRQAVALLGGAALLLSVAAVVAVGTVFPVLAHAATGQTIDVTARYYAMVVTPLAVLGVVLMGVAPSLGPGTIRWPRWVIAITGAGAAVVALAGSGRTASVALGAAAAGAAILTGAELMASRSLRRVGALLAHAGVALLLLGVAGSLLGQQSSQVVRPGGSMTLSGYTIGYHDLVLDQGPGWQRARTVLEIDQGGRQLAVLLPGLRVFSGQAAALSDVAIRATPAEDLIVSVGSIDPASRAAALNVTVRPLVLFVWWGGLLAGAGGTLVLVSSLVAGRRRPDPTPPIPTTTGEAVTLA